ncbi:hypothetical protein SK128_011287, partial [Halocaridina rubra]
LEVCSPFTPPTTDDDLLQDITFQEFREAFIFLLSQQELLPSATTPAYGDKMSMEGSSYGRTEERVIKSFSNSAVASGSEQMAKKSEPSINISQPLEDLEDKLSEKTAQQDNGSQPTSLLYSGDNEEEYLRATWQRLGVGHDGYLSLDELATVCHAIGMEKVANE